MKQLCILYLNKYIKSVVVIFATFLCLLLLDFFDNQYITSNNDIKEEKWRECKFTFLVEFYYIKWWSDLLTTLINVNLHVLIYSARYLSRISMILLRRTVTSKIFKKCIIIHDKKIPFYKFFQIFWSLCMLPNLNNMVVDIYFFPNAY